MKPRCEDFEKLPPKIIKQIQLFYYINDFNKPLTPKNIITKIHAQNLKYEG